MSEAIERVYRLFSAKTTTGVSEAIARDIVTGGKSFHVWGATTAGTGAATVTVEVSNDTTAPWVTAYTFTLTLGTVAVADGFTLEGDWAFMRGNVTAISGTGASVNLAIAS